MKNLTPQENKILQYLCFQDAEIAAILCVEKSTVKTHIHNMRKKFGDNAHTRTEALVFALKQNLITLDELKLHKSKLDE